MTRAAPSSPSFPVEVPLRAVARREAVTVCPTWVLPLAEARAWFAAARPDEVLLYAGGPRLVQGETSRWVGELAGRGLAEPSQSRSAHCYGFDFRIRKVGDPKAPPRPLDDPATRAVLAALKRAARRGERCPSDRALARAAGLPTARSAGWRVTALRDSGLIAVVTVTGPDGPWRTVTVPGTGSTEPPPSAGGR